MAFPILHKLVDQTDDIVNRVQDQLITFFNYLTNKPQLDTIVLPSFVCSEGLNVIPHTLGHNLTGYNIINQDNQSDFAQSTGTLPSIYLYLYASAPCTITLEVY